jgi:phospholipid/cholesterol/gamma-HCH transport system substrate-binding protein
MRREIRVGIFLTGALVILGVFIFVVGNLSNLFRRPGYPVIVRYTTSLGLDKSAAVKMAGIKIGYVKDIELEKTHSKVTLSIYPRFKIPIGSKAGQAVQGLLGEKYVEIQPSPSAAFVQPGGELEPGASSGMDQLAPMLTSLGADLQEVARSLKEMMNQEARANFDVALKNIARLSGEVEAFVAANREKLDRTVDTASNTARYVDQEVQTLSKSFDETLGELRQILQENRGDVRDNTAKIKELLAKIEESIRLINKSLEKVDKGEGTIGKLVNDEGLYDEARATLRDVRAITEDLAGLKIRPDLRGEYLNKGDFLKMAFSLAVWHKRRAFFMGQVVHQPDLSRPDEGRFTVSAEGGLRLGDFAPRAGIIESEFGAGLDYYALKDRLVLSVEGLDFNRPSSPLFRTFARLYPSRYVYFILGLEDFTLAARREVFFGVGVGI